MAIIDCPMASSHDANCVCAGSGKVEIGAPKPQGGLACMACGDPEQQYKPLGNMAMVNGQYVPAECTACGTKASPILVQRVIEKRAAEAAEIAASAPCRCGGKGEYIYDQATNFYAPAKCESCGVMANRDDIMQLNAAGLPPPS